MPVRKVKRQTPTGMVDEWHAAFSFGGVRHRKQGFDTKREAERWITKRTEEVSDPDYIEAQSRESKTIKMFMREWLNMVEAGFGGRVPVERSTLEGYRFSFKNNIIPFIGDVELHELTTIMVVKLREDLLRERSRQTAQRSLKFLRMAMKYAVQLGYIQSNPALGVGVTRDKRIDDKVKVPNRTEMKMILDEYAKRAHLNPERWMRAACLVHLLKGSGLRISEARGLAWNAIDFQRGVIAVNQRADYFNVIGNPKSRAARRRVPVDDVVLEWLNKWRSHCPVSDGDLVFPNSLGKVYNYANLYHRDWAPVMRDIGLVDAQGNPKYAFHGMRHYRVSDLISNGVNLRRIMDDIGHSSSAMTHDVYGHMFDEDLGLHREVLNRISSKND